MESGEILIGTIFQMGKGTDEIESAAVVSVDNGLMTVYNIISVQDLNSTARTVSLEDGSPVIGEVDKSPLRVGLNGPVGVRKLDVQRIKSAGQSTT